MLKRALYMLKRALYPYMLKRALCILKRALDHFWHNVLVLKTHCAEKSHMYSGKKP